MNFHILTLFPDMVMQGLCTSIIGRAVEQNKIIIQAIDIRKFTENKHRKVDDYPYGGGAGMLMQAQPVFDATQSVIAKIPENKKKRVVYVTPQGNPFSQKMAKEFSRCDDLLILCGHYEGIDERVLEEVVTDYVSIGDYVLTGGELAAMVIVDAVARLVPNVLNNKESAETESFHRDLLEYPQYSRPEVWHGKEVPEVLLSGDRKKIRAWRLEESVRRTKERRPDLFEKYQKLMECNNLMAKQKLLHIDMLELIARGQAKLVLFDDAHIVLKDELSGIYFHTCLKETKDIDFLERLSKDERCEITALVLHQEFICKEVENSLEWNDKEKYKQYTYTNKNKISVRGLYRPDGQEDSRGLRICRLEDAKTCAFGAFVYGKLVGSIEMQVDGAIGMLEVLPDYRRQHIGTALEVYIINWALEQGFTPYVRVREEDVVTIEMQQKLNLYGTQESIFILK